MKRWMMIGLLISLSSASVYAQESDKLHLSGSLQCDMLLAQKDSTTGAEAAGSRFRTNTYLDLGRSLRLLEGSL